MTQINMKADPVLYVSETAYRDYIRRGYLPWPPRANNSPDE